MIIEERYGEKVNAEEFSVEVKRGQLYCNPERVNILYLIGRSSYVNKDGKNISKSCIICREAFSKEKLEEFLDQKDELKRRQEEINADVLRLMDGKFDSATNRKIRIREGWALKEEDEE